ncbi:hypothetical protein ADIAL_2011 [Alkalibacterium sp. AK22]|uniref:cell wall elongation regulator TseB-like domain-containing protein n=1 Tax=Alkalibacterium sp. AK22 TaxID=1229520 RepID=UPI00044B3C67|nr:DUF5590 domain-containing protein [Alkalibacterium sp. AK22]EXJ22425.1 hypothetical protein ADIAL_2011 [Alkalibacterium sp. AK22]
MKKVLISLIIVMSVILAGGSFLLYRSIQPHSRARRDTIAFVSERTSLQEAQDFFWYNGEETFLTVTGINEEGVERIYIVQQDGGQILSLSKENTLSKEQAIQMTKESRQPDRILNARIGMQDDTPIWEISYRNQNNRLGYFIIDLRTGEWIRTIDNI